MVQQKIFIIVLNWNGWQDTIQCLNSLKTVSGGPFNILVVDNASTDESVEEISEYIQNHQQQKIALLQNDKNYGFAGGNNKGIKIALEQGAEWILLLNNDTQVNESFISELLKVAQSNHRFGMLNPKILYGEPGATKLIWFIGSKINPVTMRATHIDYQKQDIGQYDTKQFIKSDYATGCCVLVSAKLIEKIGMMPEDYFLYYEDAEWSLKARKQGFKCVVEPSSVIWHKGAASSKAGSSNYIRYHVRNGLMFVSRNGNFVQILLAYLTSIPRFLWQVIKLIFVPSKRLWAKAAMRGIIDVWLKKKGKID